MHLIKIGDRVINLEQAACIRLHAEGYKGPASTREPCVRIDFAMPDMHEFVDGPPGITFNSEYFFDTEADALRDYLILHSHRPPTPDSTSGGQADANRG